MAGHDPFEVIILLRETFGLYLIKVSKAKAHHVTKSDSAFMS